MEDGKILVLLRGAPGSGKDSFIKSSGYKPYTISADDIRLMCRNPVKLDGPLDIGNGTTIDVDHYTIDQECNPLVFEILYKVLENRLANGDFTVMNCTFSTKEEIERVKEIADKYDFEIVIVNFKMDSDSIRRVNKLRILNGGDKEEYIMFTGLKHIPEDVIETFIERFSKPLKEVIPEDIVLVYEYDRMENETLICRKINELALLNDNY